MIIVTLVQSDYQRSFVATLRTHYRGITEASFLSIHQSLKSIKSHLYSAVCRAHIWSYVHTQ